MKISTSDVKRGTILDVDGKLYKVIDTSHTHTWRWWATYSYKVKNIIDGSNLTLTYKSSVTLEQADVQTNNAVFLYAAWDSYTFMENDTAEMRELDQDDIDDIIPYLKENLDCFLMIHDNNVIWVILPTTIEYTVAQTVPWVKGDRSSAWKKPATLDNGLEVMVPLHISEWATVTINTSTWQTS